MRRNSQTLGEVLRDFFENSPVLRAKILPLRIQRGWGELLGPMVQQSTTTLYVKNRVLHVSLTSAVLRSELLLCRERLVKSLNEYAEADVIDDIVIR